MLPRRRGDLTLTRYVHDVEWVPEDGVGVEVGGGVEPEHELLLALALAVAEDVGVQEVGLAAHVAQELKVHLVVPRASSADLHRSASSSLRCNLIKKEQKQD